MLQKIVCGQWSIIDPPTIANVAGDKEVTLPLELSSCYFSFLTLLHKIVPTNVPSGEVLWRWHVMIRETM